MKISDLIKAQIFGLDQLDNKTIQRLEPLLRTIVNQLKTNLQNLSDDDFNYMKKRQTLSMIESALYRMEDIAKKELITSAESYNRYAITQSEKEISALARMPIVPINRQVLSLNKNHYLINRMEASIKTYTVQTRDAIVRALQQAILQNISGHKVTVNLQKYLDIKEWRVQRIVRTELHNVFNATKILSYSHIRDNYLPDLKKALWHPMDERTADDSKKLRKLDPIIDIDEPFKFKWKGKERVFMNPPDRPNDRSVLVPYREKWSDRYS